MHILCLKDDFQKALSIAERHTSGEHTIPLLKGMLLCARDNTFSVRVTNLDTGFEASIPAKIKKEGSVVVPARTLSSLLATFSDEKIQLEVKNNNMTLTTSSASITLKGYPPEDFPPFPKIKKGNTISLSSDGLGKDLLSVAIAASTSEIKPEIASILFVIQKNGIKFAATDSFRLAEKTIPFSHASHHTLLFPHRHIIELVKIIDVFPSPISLSFDEHQAVFQGEHFLYLARLRDATFPNYEQIIPTSFSTEVMLKKSDLMQAIRGAGIFSGRLREVGFNIYPEDNLFEAVARNSDMGEYVSHIQAKVTGERLTMNFNYTYIMDGLNHIHSEHVMLRFNGEARPVLMQSPHDAAYIYLAMPMKHI